MYKIFIDKSKLFECDIKIEGASLDESEVRLCLEAKDFCLAFKGEINKNGDVKIPIKKLKGILEENYVGKISLEVIAEDTLFVPWESEFQAALSKKVEVSFNDSLLETKLVDEKPKVTFKLKEEKFNKTIHVNEIFNILKSKNANIKKLYKNPNIFNKLIETYCKVNNVSDHFDEIKKETLRNIRSTQ
jgi:hypothetical protein